MTSKDSINPTKNLFASKKHSYDPNKSSTTYVTITSKPHPEQRVRIRKGKRSSQCVVINPLDIPKKHSSEPVQLEIHAAEAQMSRILELTERFSQNGELADFLNLAEEHAEHGLLEFKRSVKKSSYSPAQYELVQTLNTIEKKITEFPLVTPKQATQLLGMFASSNPSRDIGKLVKQNKLFGFSFGESKVLQLPAFQFDDKELKAWPPVNRLCELLSNLNDWAVYDWLTTDNDDLGTTPAEALKRPDLYDDLLDIAGLYRNENKHAHLSFNVKEDSKDE